MGDQTNSGEIAAMLQNITARLQALEHSNQPADIMSQDNDDPPDEVSWESVLTTNTVQLPDFAACELAMLCGVPPPWAKSEKH